MAKKKNSEQDENSIYEELALETGGQVLSKLENCKFFVDTGSFAVNFVCSGRMINGGIPGNRITEMYGPSSSGKSLIGSNVLYGAQKMNGWAIILDTENATNAEWMEKASHLNANHVIRYTPFTLEEAFLKIHNSVKKIREHEKKNGKARRPIVILYDSITVSPCARELKEVDLPEDYNPTMWKKIVGAKEQPGERARVISKELRKLMPILEADDVTIVIINQTRMQIGVMYGNPETTPGGKALEFYASCRLRTQQRMKIEQKVKNSAVKSYAGVNMQIQNVKNRAFRPFVKTENVKLYFETGMNPISGILNPLLEDKRIYCNKSGNYEVAKEFLPEGKEACKFKSSQERGDIPLEVILECPALVNAVSKEEIIAYLTPFQASIEATDSADFTETSVMYDSDGSPVDDSFSPYEEDEDEEDQK